MKTRLLCCAALLRAILLASAPAAGARGVVVSSQRTASEAGAEILRQGGNAVDAAIATGMALAVVHPSAGNIGGGGFMLVMTPAGEVTAFDFREKAPLAATPGMFLGPDGRVVRNSNHEGHRAAGVPGTVAGFDLARQRFSRKSWRELTAPAIRLAKEGIALTPAVAGEFAGLAADWRKNPAAAAIFLKPDGSPWQAGEIWCQPLLAATLERIALEGRAGFYGGTTARLIAADMKAHGGLITEADLTAYEARERRPVRGRWHGMDVYSMPPPSSGGIALIEMLNMLEGDDLKFRGHNSAPYLHLLAETMRRGFADRAQFCGDPDFNPGLPVERLLSKEHATALRRTIHMEKASVSDPSQFNDAWESPETTHYSIMDAAGMAVVVTYTLEYSYGARIAAEGLGFLYNNEMGDFNPRPGHTDATGTIGTAPNVIAPGKRMLSSMTPAIVVRDGKPWLLVGSPGGRTIINTVLQVILNLTVFEMELPQALAAGRIHHQWLPDELRMEPAAATPETVAALKKLGHTVKESSRQGRVTAILADPAAHGPAGAVDPRDPDAAAVSE